MADEDLPEDESTDDEGEEQADGLHQEFQFSPVSARVPERIARGVFSTGAIVLNGPDEFVIDFILRLSHPNQLVARIVLPKSVLPRFIGALEENLTIYRGNFGGLPQMPVPQQPSSEAPPDSIGEMYEQLKPTDELLCGSYANAVMIGHSGAEYWFDFIVNIVPRSIVTARVFMAAPQVPGLHEALVRSWQQFVEQQERPESPEEESDEVDEDPEEE